MDYLTEICRPVEAELADFRLLMRRSLTCDVPLLGEALEHISKRGGKMLRPALTLLAAKWAGEVNGSVMHAAAALELLHTASLVHDDVVDSSDRRRGQASVNAMFGAKAAVLVGDYLFSMALRHASLAGDQRVAEWLAELGRELSDGELRQMAGLSSNVVSELDYFEVIGKKTASLFAACAGLGAWLGGGGDKMARRMRLYGRCVGVCFQLRDDLLDYDDMADTGKPSGQDMREGKLTLPALRAVLSDGGDEAMALALRVRRGEASEEEVKALVKLAREGGGMRYTEERARKYSRRAAALVGNRGQAEAADALRLFARFAAERRI